MRKINITTGRLTPVLLILLASISFFTTAQKLPNVQKVSVWAPANIKIDGKATEWDDKYQAYNNATDIYYTLSNDKDNIYLIIEAKKSIVIGSKILGGGISFTINHTLKKKDTASVTITYPTLQVADRGAVDGLFYGMFAGNHMNRDPKADNSLAGLNNAFAAKSKFIKITGIKEIPDGELSVYNDQGIKAVSAFNKPVVYVYELAIPLKFLALPNNGADGFSYHIKLNISKEMKRDFVSGPTTMANSNLPETPRPQPDYVSETDFWGEYILAKK